jgi:maltooligosyltrehalose trehalohydrolase
VAVACVLFSLNTPLLFMGDEYGERNPFQFFTDHSDDGVADRTREGRRQDVMWATGTPGPQPDPQDQATFLRSKLEPREVEPLVRDLLALRASLPRELHVEADGERVTMRRGNATLTLDFRGQTVDLHT